MIELPELHDDFEPTRATLHGYARAITLPSRTHGVAHPLWWHVSLKPRPEGLVGDPVPLPDGKSLAVALAVPQHAVVVSASDGWQRRWDLRDGLTTTELGDAVLAAASERGLEGPYDRSRFEDDSPRHYDPTAADAYFAAFTAMHGLFERHRVGLGMRVSPIQVWPHGFDLAFDWFGTRTAEHGSAEAPAQLNLGFYPGGTPYLYSNPWPFDESLVGSPLPHGAEWHTEGWQGTTLSYETVRTGDAADIVAGYARAVFDLASPTLGVG